MLAREGPPGALAATPRGEAWVADAREFEEHHVLIGVLGMGERPLKVVYDRQHFAQDRLVDFAAMDGNLFGGFDPQFHLVTTYVDDRDDDVIADHDALFAAGTTFGDGEIKNFFISDFNWTVN